MKKILLISVLISTILVSCSEHYGNGERIGVITRWSRSGLIFKSWEGELHVTQTGMNSTMRDFDFSVDNNIEEGQLNIIKTLDSAAKLAWKVRVIYHEVSGKNITGSRGDTNFFVDSVQVEDRNMSSILRPYKDTGISGQSTGIHDTIYVVIYRDKPKN